MTTPRRSRYPALLVSTCLLLAGHAALFGQRRLAIVIGNDHYRYTTSLRTPINDAHAVETELRGHYGFEVRLLLDASRAEIMEALNSSRRELDSASDLLIYYAGHGYYDAAVEKAYWWPIDARAGDNSNWISADDITANVKGTAARHILIVSDSCFSGTLTRGLNEANTAGLQSDRANALAKLRERASREVLASGGNEPVDDGGGGQHSVFAAALLRALEQMPRSQFAAAELFQDVRESVAGRSAQLPQLDAVRNSGHDGGSFIFTRSGAPGAGISTTAAGAETGVRGPRTGGAVPTKMNEKDGLTYVWIPPGSFAMGCSGEPQCSEGEKPVHRVTITDGFWLGQTLVTQQAYQRIIGHNPSEIKGSKLPVTNIDFDAALAYCFIIGGRLPTEAEWEYAARGGTTGSIYGELDQVAWYHGNSGDQPHEVGQKQPNAFGLYDMLGGGLQWVADGYGPYRAEAQTDPKVAANSQAGTLRGTAWFSIPTFIRVSFRSHVSPLTGMNYFGLRCVSR